MLEKIRKKLAVMLSPSEKQILSPSGITQNQTKNLSISDYNAELIPVFKKEHRVLLALYQRINSNAKTGRSEEVRTDLKKFKLLLTGHLLKENQHLYIYLFKTLTDRVSIDMVKDMKTEMDGIGTVVLSFISKYSKYDSKIDKTFIKDFEEIGAALVSRIQNEEQHLYPSYVPGN